MPQPIKDAFVEGKLFFTESTVEIYNSRLDCNIVGQKDHWITYNSQEDFSSYTKAEFEEKYEQIEEQHWGRLAICAGLGVAFALIIKFSFFGN